MPGLICATIHSISSAIPTSPKWPSRKSSVRADEIVRLIFCDRERPAAIAAPSTAPIVFDKKSSVLATRCGRNICSDSIENERTAPTAVPSAMRMSGDARVGSHATKKPNGQYAMMLNKKS